MAKQTAVDSLKESIRLLEIRQVEEGLILKEQFKISYESLKLVNLIKNSFKEITSSIEVKSSFFETIVSLLTGYLSKKIMVSPNSNIFKKILGTILQFGVSSVVAKNADLIMTVISDLIDRFLHPEEDDEEEEIAEPEVR
ncbi:MAG TPA: hypothetical protein VFC65_03125 [Prolixibacteraceae bacterium]|nr:hypothetical protein [Prolixibacteraceae bacterium]